MNKTIIDYFFVFIFSLFVSFPCLAAKHETKVNIAAFDKSFHSLDSLIKEKHNITNAKLERIENYKKSLLSSKNNAERLVFTRLIFTEYDNFDTDSALLYAGKLKDILKSEYPDDKNMEAEANLYIANTLIMQGTFDEASSLLNSIKVDELNGNNKAYYFEVKEHLANTLAVYMASESTDWDVVKKEINLYRDSIIAVTPESPERWLWVPLARKIDGDRSDTIAHDDKDVLEIIRYMENHPEASQLNAVHAYWLFRFYKTIGDRNNQLRYLLEGAQMDEILSNREIVTLQDLATFLFENEYNTKSYQYMLEAVTNAEALRDRSRMVDIVRRILEIGKKYKDEKAEADKEIRGLVIALSIISFVLLIALSLIIYFYLRIRRSKIALQNRNAILNLDNDTLKQTVEETEETINRMDEENTRLEGNIDKKNEIVIASLKTTANAYHYIENFRRQLLKPLRENKIKDLGIIINDPELIKEIYREFYINFDKTLLSIYPEFINVYNENVPEEFRVDADSVIKKKSLTTRLRIFALYQIGLEKSSDIARILNISIQTVYNTKSELFREAENPEN